MVRVIKDKDKVMKLQKGHGEWNESMTLLLGTVGKIKSIYLDGDLRVKVFGNVVTLNPDCVEMVSADTKHDSEIPNLMKLLDMMSSSSMDDARKSDESDKSSDDDQLDFFTDAEIKFFAALCSGSLGDMREVIDFVDVNKAKQSVTPLMIAAKENRLEIAQLLITHRADVNMKNVKGNTALHISISSNHFDMCTLLINYGADINSKNNDKITPIMVAAHSGPEDILTLLVNRPDANLNLGDSDGDTPLHLAIQKSRIDLVRILLGSGANIRTVNDRQFNAYHLAALRGNERILEMFLKKEGALIVNLQKDDKFTALHLSALNNHPECIKLLINYNADLNIRNSTLQTALHVAVSQKHLKCVKILVEHKAELNLKDDGGDTPLHDAIRMHNMERIRKMGSVAGLGGMLQLLEGFHKGSDKPEDIIMYLVDNGAKMDVENNVGRTAMTTCEDKILRSQLLTIENRTKRKTSKDVLIPQLLPAEKSRDEQMEELRTIIEKMEREKTCVVCLDRRINVTFGCGHVTCDVCANNLFVCHICRVPVDRKIRIFN